MTMRQTGAPDDPAAQAICRTPDWDLVSGLPWVRFDTSMPDNPKILELVSMREGRAAAFVYCCGLAYSGKHSVGLWVDVPGGWLIHGWADRQESTDETQARKERAQKAAAARWTRQRKPGA
jgi:hypothetical protein